MSEGSPQPTATGSFERTPFPHVLVYLHARELSGTLEIRDVAATHTVYFQKGCPAKVRSTAPVELLGEVLLEMGLIDRGAHESTAEAVSAGQGLYGQLLLAAGALTMPTLIRGLKEQITRRLLRLFDLHAGDYSYYDGVNVLRGYGGDEVLRIDPLPILYRGIRASYDDARLNALLGPVREQLVRIVPTADVRRFGLSADEVELCTRLQGEATSLDRIERSSPVPRLHTRALVYCLLITKQIEFVDAAAASPAPAPAPPASASQRIAPPPPASASQKMAPPPGPPASASQKIAAPPASAPQKIAPPVPPASASQKLSPAAPPTSASQRMAPPPPPASASQKLPAPSSGARASVAGAVPVRRKSAPVVVQKTVEDPEIAGLRADIIARAGKIEVQSYFEMLEVGSEASPDAVRDAYFKLAKLYHPDRARAELEDLRDTLEYIFSNVSEAYGTLSDKEKRNRYVSLLREGGGTMADQRKIQGIVDAAMNHQKAEVCLRRRDFAEAERLAQLAVEAGPDDGEYLALYHWIRLQQRGADAEIEDLLEALRRAQLKAKDAEKPNFYYAMALKRAGNMPQAIPYFKRASVANPRNLDAIRELRLWEMRREKGGPPEGGGSPKGLFGRLFKK